MTLRNTERIALTRFNAAMLAKLRANSDRHWADCTRGYLMQRLWEEVAELQEAVVTKGMSADEIRGEAADVANFAMMVADICGGLKS